MNGIVFLNGTSFSICYQECIGTRCQSGKCWVVPIVYGSWSNDFKSKWCITIYNRNCNISSKGRTLNRRGCKVQVSRFVKGIQSNRIGNECTAVRDVSYGNGIGTIGKVREQRRRLKVHSIDTVFECSCTSCSGTSLNGYCTITGTCIRSINNCCSGNRVSRIKCNGECLLTLFAIPHGIVIGTCCKSCVNGLG